MKPILILDFGSQFAHLIGNRVRRLSAFSEIVPVATPIADIIAKNPAGIILSGGPQSVFANNSPKPDPAVFDLGIPILGICYGHQLLAHHFGGTIESAEKEFGEADFVHSDGALFANVPQTSKVFMNHGDAVVDLPDDFEIVGKTEKCRISSFQNPKKQIFSLQFHPEVTHSEFGQTMLENFVDLCGAKGSWKISDAINNTISDIQQKVTDKNVFLLVSGGVDSSVAFALLEKALGKDRVFGLFVDTGFLRKNEAVEVEKMLVDAGFQNLHVADEKDLFLERCAGLFDPEEKRAAIGSAFLEVKRKWAEKLNLADEQWMLGQGTIYPDTIETGGTEHASKIKTHHNRVPEIEQLIAEGRVIEPLSDFYKDEVREIGRQLGLPEKMVARHPFPGPGLGVRILCLKEAYPLKNSEKLESQIESQFSVLAKVLPIQSVGVQGDARSYRHPVCLFSEEDLSEAVPMGTRIVNDFSDLNRAIVCLSSSQKPEKIFVRSNVFLTSDRVAILQNADAKIRRILEEKNLESSVWQFPVVLAPIGFSPDTESIILRPIQSENAMTANPVLFSSEIFMQMTQSLLEISEISAVFLDITSKPPGTIEWE